MHFSHKMERNELNVHHSAVMLFYELKCKWCGVEPGCIVFLCRCSVSVLSTIFCQSSQQELKDKIWVWNTNWRNIVQNVWLNLSEGVHFIKKVSRRRFYYVLKISHLKDRVQDPRKTVWARFILKIHNSIVQNPFFRHLPEAMPAEYWYLQWSFPRCHEHCTATIHPAPTPALTKQPQFILVWILQSTED